MSERLTAQFRDASICAFDLINENGQYLEEMRSKIRVASQEGLLLCPECKSRLILCAGVIREPYFRHFTLGDCEATITIRTDAGKRRYKCRKLLYELAKRNGCNKLTMEEGKQNMLMPILFETQEGQTGYVFLDGKSRNYKELKDAAREYKYRGIKLLFFLAMKNMSNGKNISSDEAETAKLNKGIIYYIDEKQEHIAMRKQYEDISHVRRYCTRSYEIAEIQVDVRGDICKDFLNYYGALVREEKCKIPYVLRVPIEDGIDEAYFDMDYVCMDSLEEIWILPDFLHEIEDSGRARENRIKYVTYKNEEFADMLPQEQSDSAFALAKALAKKRNSWDWES